MADFTLRPWKICDLECLVKNANNINNAKFMSEGFPLPYTAEKGNPLSNWRQKVKTSFTMQLRWMDKPWAESGLC